MQIDANISKNLNKDEKEIFAILKEVIQKYTPTTQAFAVGGWVRDKLIGIPSDDIDIMLSNISGEEFAKLVTRHMEIKDAHTIRGNPEKSKHITTSKAYIPLSSGKVQEVDFAQARQEVYKENSRIPDIKPATPQEDATRRDLTINAIFYNIMENKIEDFTGMGIKDLVANVIRTPADPIKTFSEDPLRIFRTIRMAAKYNGQIDPETYRAMNNHSLREIIRKKLAVERIGQELIKMLKNNNPQRALQILKDTGLLEDIFIDALKGSPYEGKLSELSMDQNSPHHKLSLWEHTMKVVEGILEKYQDADPEKRVAMLLAALMHDIGKLYKEIWGESKSYPGRRSYHGHEEESSKMIDYILRYLKIEPYIQQVSNLAKEHMRPHRLSNDEGGARSLRRFIRQCGEISLDWVDVFNLAVADAYAKDVIRDPNTIKEYQELENRLRDALSSLSPVSNKPELKPILNGNEIMQVLNIKPGQHMKEIIEFVKELKDENPNITKEDATQKLKDKYLSPEIKQAGKKETSSTCPKQLLRTKLAEINSLYKDKKYYEVLTILGQLKQDYGNDDSVVRLLAIGLFKLLIKGEKYRYNELIQHVLDKAQLNFFDHVLCSYSVGILLLIETQTKDNVIKEIALRMSKMSPKTLMHVIDLLPEEIYRKNLKEDIEEILSENN